MRIKGIVLYNECKTCGTKDDNKFMPSRDSICSDCFRLWTKSYEKTFKGFTMRMYRNMQSRIEGVQKAKSHLYVGKSLWTREEFYKWIENNITFLELFERYKQSGYDRKLAPSVDRIDSSQGYNSENCEIVTHSENSSRSSRGRNKRTVN